MKNLRVLNRYFENFFARKFAAPFIRKETKNIVASGPFAGMKYVDDSVGSRLLPKLLGTYELELRPVIEKICRERFDVIIDVGAAEGYYAVGLALSNSQAKVIAFETEERGRGLLRKMADLNGVGNRVSILGRCDIKALSEQIPEDKKCLVVMDIEGGEQILLDNAAIPKLNSCYILVEAHEFAIPGIVEVITARFKDTHKFMEIKERRRVPEDFPRALEVSFIYRSLFGRYFIINSMWEGRYDDLLPRPEKNAGWLYLEPK